MVGVRIADLLSTGRENGRKLRELARLQGIDERTVRLVIQQERLAGAPIISDNANGYFLAGNPTEAQQFARSMRHRSREILRVAEAVEKAVPREESADETTTQII